jgi:hypothetical protein
MEHRSILVHLPPGPLVIGGRRRLNSALREYDLATNRPQAAVGDAAGRDRNIPANRRDIAIHFAANRHIPADRLRRALHMTLHIHVPTDRKRIAADPFVCWNNEIRPYGAGALSRASQRRGANASVRQVSHGARWRARSTPSAQPLCRRK